MKKNVLALIISSTLFWALAASGNEPGWERGVIKFGAERQQIRSTPILERPYRPLHVYGNVVRRRYYHGRVLPTSNDVSRSVAANGRTR